MAAFGIGQVKKAETAWEEYEAGYEELTKSMDEDISVEDFERPKFWQKGYFKGPEGEVRIGDTMYDRGQIQKAGGFLGSDAAGILSDKQRQEYLGRTAPGTAVSQEQLTSELRGRQEAAYKTFLSDPENIQTYGESLYGGAGMGDVDKSRQMLADAGQRQNYSGVDEESLAGSGLSGAEYDKLVQQRQVQYAQDMYEPITSMNRVLHKLDIDTPKEVPVGPQIPDQNLPIPNMNFYERKRYNIWNQLSEKYGPQRGEYDPQTGQKRYNLMDALYENNERRKKY
tara:strand:- start:13 stop:861 length:849 start_codon:yes stop_codon:yes gene_type:complete